jgi:hypothetical protein
MKVQASAGEIGPNLKQLRNRLLHLEPIAEDGSIKTSAGEANTACAPYYRTREFSQGQMTKKTSEKTDLEFQVQYLVAKVFEPTKEWQKRWAGELATSLDSLERMQQLAAGTLAPMKALCEDMRNLPNAFAPLRAFQEQLGVLAKSFAPMKELHQKLALMLEDAGAPFIQLAKSLELTKLSPERIARLASTFEAAAEIQTEFEKLAQAFNRTSPATLMRAQKAA